jgi:hypothetical protein
MKELMRLLLFFGERAATLVLSKGLAFFIAFNAFSNAHSFKIQCGSVDLNHQFQFKRLPTPNSSPLSATKTA